MPGVAIGIYLPLVAAHGRIAAHINHLLVYGDCLVGLVLLLINGAEAFEEDAAVVLFLGGISAIGVRGEVNHGRVSLSGLVEAAQHVEHQAFVVAGFKAGGVQLARLLDGGQRIFKLALAALNLGDMHQGLGVIRIGGSQVLELRERLVELVVAEQGLAKGVHGARVAGFHIGGALIG